MFQTEDLVQESTGEEGGLYLFKSDIQSATNFRPTAVWAPKYFLFGYYLIGF